jgi:beta-phosphoglucomutase
MRGGGYHGGMAKGCVIFDFDGVIADTERFHLVAYNEALAAHAGEIGGALAVSADEYFGKYIVYGDREGLMHMLRDKRRPCGGELVRKLAAAKHELFLSYLDKAIEPLPGVGRLLGWLEERNVPRAICSGARRGEIEMILDSLKLRHHFDVMVTIEDVRLGKPEPEGYNLAFERLNLEYDAELEKGWSLVVEDSAGGCAAAKAAGMRVLGVATSLPMEELRGHVTWAVGSLAELRLEEVAGWLGIGGLGDLLIY